MIPRVRTHAPNNRRRMWFRRGTQRWLLLVALLAAGSTAACGGGAKERASSTPALNAGRTTNQPTGAGGSTATRSRTLASRPPPTRSRRAVEPNVTERAISICARRNRELDGSGATGTSSLDLTNGSPRAIPIEERAVKELHRLNPSRTVARNWRTVLADTELSLRALVQLAESTRSSARKSASVNAPLLWKYRWRNTLVGDE
jgi:hypothetical protein